jgi:serine/threonine-protein kinase
MALQLQEGDLLLERYRIEHVVGQGGMAVVVSALCEETLHRVAIKYLNAEALQDPNVTQRFEREARAAARLTSRHVPVVIESGRSMARLPGHGLLQGRDPEQLLEQGSRSRPCAVDIVLMVRRSGALLGIVHRDLAREPVPGGRRARAAGRKVDSGSASAQHHLGRARARPRCSAPPSTCRRSS